jgi:hypothetical protein
MSPGLDIRLHLLNSFLFKNSKLLIHPHDEPVTSHQAPRGGGGGPGGWGGASAVQAPIRGARCDMRGRHYTSLGGQAWRVTTHLASAHGVLGGTT